ncbi:MAG: hypothetical protein J0H12_00470 [Candidatus Paracaedimonas acanthamoebae]|uniref:Uncharacterized protein n=1 Tax=Candidatus Paracaedimonas acanthamoebae TaxID=244581 RepID=A0A8J7TU52_9PROT|nr:hypothetical protein [Candidatus Paracaedimonas acanthamoebae]
MFLNKLKIWSQYKNFLQLILIISAVFTPHAEVYSTELTGDEILRNHQILQRLVNDCYTNFSGNHYKTYFNPGHDRNFNFRGNINFCAGGIQWMMRKTDSDEYIITPFTPFRGKTGKRLIFSNTSTYQWSGRELDTYQILSWPYERIGDELEDGKIEYSLEPYHATFLEEMEEEFGKWLKKEAAFDRKYFPRFFPHSCKKKDERKSIVNRDVSTDFDETKTKYFRALDQVDFESYKHLFVSDTTPEDLIDRGPNMLIQDADHNHSEPLFCWWVQQNIESLKEAIISSKPGYDVVYPIISLYTERQTCLIPCEQVVQKCATNSYVPLISFSKPYERNKEIILAGLTSKINLGNNEMGFPPSTMVPAIKLSVPHLEGIIGISKPDFVNWEIVSVFQPSENTQHLRGITRFPIQFQLD